MGPKKAKKTKKQLEEEKSNLHIFCYSDNVFSEKLEEEKRIHEELEKKRADEEERKRLLEDDKRRQEEEKRREEEYQRLTE